MFELKQDHLLQLLTYLRHCNVYKLTFIDVCCDSLVSRNLSMAFLQSHHADTSLHAGQQSLFWTCHIFKLEQLFMHKLGKLPLAIFWYD